MIHYTCLTGEFWSYMPIIERLFFLCVVFIYVLGMNSHRPVTMPWLPPNLLRFSDLVFTAS